MRFQKVTSLILAAALVIGVLPGAYAQELEEEEELELSSDFVQDWGAPEEDEEEIEPDSELELNSSTTVTDYEYSTAYPNTWVNTGDQAYDIAQIALTQVGYTETADNHTKYNAWYYGYDQSAAWCAIFVSWCANQAGVTSIKKSTYAYPGDFGIQAYAFSTVTPAVGDIVFFENNGALNYGNVYGYDHVGIVYAVDNDYIYTVEGNKSNSVATRSYVRSTGKQKNYPSTYIAWIGKPNYSNNSGDSKEPPRASITNATLPKHLVRYNNFPLWATLSVDYGRITVVWAAIYSMNDPVTPLMDAIAYPNAMSYEIHDGPINNTLKFGNLADGKYFYVLNIDTEYNGKTVGPNYITQPFTVGDSTEHQFQYYHESEHPHIEMRECMCGINEATGRNVYVDSCVICNPLVACYSGNHTNYTVWGYAATCTANGLSDGLKCSVCGTTTKAQEVIPATGHATYNVLGYAATCTANGLSDGLKCSVCGTITKAQEVIPATGHTMNGIAFEPAHPHREYQQCSTCGETFYTGTNKEYSSDCQICNPPTPTVTDVNVSVDGNTVTVSFEAVDGATSYDVYLIQAPYSWEDIKYHKETTDTTVTFDNVATGSYVAFIVSRPNDNSIQSDWIFFETHTHSYTETETLPTCTKEGYTTYTCTQCDDVYVNNYTSALGHCLVSVTGKAATCTASGITDGEKCSVCGTVTIAQDVILAKGHKPETVPGEAATCAESGLTDSQKCSTCGTVLQAAHIIPAAAHTMVTIPGRAATCIVSGLSDGKVCSVCGEVVEKQIRIAAKGHSYNGGKCTVCGDLDKSLTGMYRLYNPYTLEHMFNSSAEERDILLNVGWTLDGFAFYTPSSGKNIYRLYNPAEDWHTYSTIDAEIEQLIASGWTVDGIMGLSASEDQTPVYKMYNPYERINYWHFCSDTVERDWLVSLGWIYEGIAWYAIR